MKSDTLDFCLTLSRAQASLARRFEGTLGAIHGLGFSDFMVLHYLNEAPGGRLRRVDLAERLGLTVSGATRALLPMEKIGLVTRQADARDARVAYAAITPAGKQKLEDALIDAEDVSRQALSGVKPDDLRRLIDLLDGIGGRRSPVG